MSVAGPFHPFIPCAAAALQPREYFLREPVVVDAPLGCVWYALGLRNPHSNLAFNLALTLPLHAASLARHH